MLAGIPSLPVRSSPTSRSVLQRASQLAHVQPAAHSLHSVAGTMLSRAPKHGAGNAPSAHNGRAKQLFPSVSPGASNGDIRDQLRKSGSAAASVSARTTQSLPNPLVDRSANATQQQHSRGNARGALQSLHETSDPFKLQTHYVDLTGPDPKTKMHEAVYFAEDDFSDDENLDLDYQAPSALPSVPRPPKPVVQESRPQVPPTPSQPETVIPWSSSPATHLLPPNPTRTLSGATQSSLKRESSGENCPSDVPVQKRAKKRVLPASFRQDGPEQEEELYAATIKTPALKTQRPWDTSASAIKQQKKQLKNQRNPRPAGPDGSAKNAHQDSPVSKAVPISLSSEQRHVLDLVVNKKASVFFTGPAGTGKSVLMRAIISELKKKHEREPERVAVTASTGLAACNIGGITLHSFAGIGLGKEDASTLVKKVRRNPKAKNRWLKTKCLVIDEISMVDGDLFDKLSHIGRVVRNDGRPWGGIQLIITGDFFQLPPVPDHEKKREAKFAFDSATWNTSIDHTIGLTQVFRQRDPEFARMLNEMRLGKIAPSTAAAFKALSRPLKFDDGVDSAELYPTRAQVDKSNVQRLQELPGKLHRYEAMDAGDPAIRDRLLSNMMAPKSLDLKVDAQVMLIKNMDETLVNGSLGKVIAFSDEKTFEMSGDHSDDTDLDDAMSKARKKLSGFSHDADGPPSSTQKYPVVQFISTGGVPRVILCQPEEWKVELPNGEVQAKRTQLPLILAWALSIHKAQGQTLERVTVNLGRVFEKGQAYVALSRATSQHGLRVLGFDRSKVMAHQRVVDFYGKLYTAEQANGTAGLQPYSVESFAVNGKGMRPQPPALAQPSSTSTSAKVIDLDDDEAALASYGY